MPQDLQTLISRMSPGSLALYKKQLATLPDRERQRVFSQLSGIPELADIIGETPAGLKVKTQPQQAVQPMSLGQQVSPAQPAPTGQQADVPFWQKALSTVAAPFNWIQEHVSEPFGAIVTSPWTPAVEGTQGKDWLGKELAEYRQAKLPWGVKGTLEFLPWLAVPSALGTAGKLVGAGAKLATMGGVASKVAPAVKGAGLALKYSPYGLMESATGAALRPVSGILSKAVNKVIGKEAKPVPSKVWGALTKTERGVIASELGLSEKVGQKAWSRLTVKEKEAVSNAVLKPAGGKEATTVGKEIGGVPTSKPTVKSPTITQAIPSGFSKPQEVSVGKLTDLVKKAELRTKETLKLRKPEQAARINEFETLIGKFRNQGMSAEQAMGRAEQALRGKYPEAVINDTMQTIRNGLTEGDIANLFEIVADGQYTSGYHRLNTYTALQDLLANNVMQRNQIILLEKTFGSDLAKALLGKIGLGKRAGELAVDLANAPRALLASCDISGLLRQGGILFARHPIEGIQTVKPMLSALLSDRNELIVDSIIRARPGMDELIEAGLYISPTVSQAATRLAEREEAFMSNLMSRFPIIRASNRAYVTGLNDLRSRSALSVLNGWKKAGIKYTKEDLADLSQLVNWASGRGSLPKVMQKQGALLNSVLFSPKLIFSRVEFPTTVLPMVTKSPLVRREAWKTLLSFTGAGAGILTMAKLSGAADVELDPRSADFGKLKVGDTRLDIWTGYTQYLRFAAQLATAQRKTAGGRVQTLNRKEVIDRFVQTKYSPAMGLVNDLLKGETYLGEELPPKSAKGVLGQVYQRMMPLSIQDLVDGIQQDGVLGGIVSSAGILGVGVVTYTDEVKKERDKEAKKQYGMTWDEVGRTYGRAEQLKLEQTSQGIIDAEKEQEKRFSVGTPSTMTMWQNEGQGIEEQYRESISLAAKEFRATGDGTAFRDKVDSASNYRRQAYAARAKREDYQDIVAYYNQPIDPKKATEMNPGDVARREYYQRMYSPDMYDEYGNYRFDLAEQREKQFLAKYGQQALNYIEEYSGARWVDKPAELKVLEQARDTLRPYWQIADAVWSMYPAGMRELSEQIALTERTNPAQARQMLKRYPAILRARELIARYKRNLRLTNPTIDQAFRTFYS